MTQSSQEKKLIAVCGKGGSGKTALVAILTKHILQDDGALLTAGHGNRLAAQGRVGLLLNRCKERIHIDVHDGFHKNNFEC